MRSMGATMDLASMPARPPAMRFRISFGRDRIVQSTADGVELLLLEADIVLRCVVVRSVAS